jgi:hypothetical protein
MKLLFNYFILFFFLTAFVACKPKPITSPVDFFDVPIKLNHEIFIDDAEGLMAYDLKYIQDSLLILFNPGQRFLYDLINLNTKKKILQFGKIGEGPGELAMPTQLSFWPNNPSELGIYNRRAFQFVDIKFDSILQSTEYVYSRIYKGFDFGHYGLYKLSENQFLGLGYFKNRYVISDSTGQIIKEWGDYPFENELVNLSFNQKAFAYQGKFKVHPKEPKFVFAAHNSPNFEIIEFDEKNILTQISQNRIFPPKVSVNDPDSYDVAFDLENIVSYVDASVTENHIYLLFFGETVKNIVDREIKGAKNILVFDWKGNPVNFYNLDIGVSHIEVVDDKIIYAVNQKEKGHLYKFKLE